MYVDEERRLQLKVEKAQSLLRWRPDLRRVKSASQARYAARRGAVAVACAEMTLEQRRRAASWQRDRAPESYLWYDRENGFIFCDIPKVGWFDLSNLSTMLGFLCLRVPSPSHHFLTIVKLRWLSLHLSGRPDHLATPPTAAEGGPPVERRWQQQQ